MMGCCTAKYMALAVFVLQNAGVILLMRYSKVHATAQTGYNSAVAVLMCELVKMPACALLLAVERGGVCAFVSSVADDLRTNGREWLQLSLPALLYVVQNNMLFIGLANLEAAVAQVTYQLKIFITALFTVCLLGRRLGAIQWFGLFLLTLGVLCVQGLPEKLAARALNKMAGGASAGGATAVDAESAHATLVGVSAVLVACFCSSFAGVYFEMMLKRSQTSLWLRNIQLGVWSLFIAVGSVYLSNDPLIATHGPLHGFGPIPWAVVGMNAFGGLLVAVTIKYADNILRGFAQAVAIIFGALGACLRVHARARARVQCDGHACMRSFAYALLQTPLCSGSRFLFGFTFTRDFCIGVVLVIAAILLYGDTCSALYGGLRVAAARDTSESEPSSNPSQPLLDKGSGGDELEDWEDGVGTPEESPSPPRRGRS